MRLPILAAIAFALLVSGGADAMAVKQALGPNTQVTVYDDTNPNAGGDGSYGIADVKAAMDVLVPGQANVQELVGGVNFLPYSAGRKQYLLDVDVVWGGDGTDGTLPTTWVDKNIDIFWRVGAPKFRLGAGPITTRLGTKIGVAPSGLVPATMMGLDGVNIFIAGTAAFRNDLFIYGCMILCGGSLQILSTGALAQEIAGNILDCNNSTSVMGDSLTIGVWYNNLIRGRSATAVWGTSRHLDEDQNIIAGASPLQLIGLGSGNGTVRARRPRYAGAPTRVINFTGADASDIKLLSPISPAGVRLFNYSSDKTPAQGAQQFSTLNTRVGFGATPLANIPVRLESDVDGAVVDTITFSDGDLGFVNGPSGYQNGIQVRDHYQTAGVELFRDRVYTLRVNEAGLANPRNATYGSRRIVFKWAGQTTGFFRPMEIAVDLPLAQGPTANFGSDKGGGAPPLLVQFADESIAGDQPITAWAWTFGDGGTSTAQNPSHTYAAPGTYTVGLTVTTSVAQSTKSYPTLIYVQAPSPPPIPTIALPYLGQKFIAIELRKTGKDVSAGGVTVKGLVDRFGEPVLVGEGSHVIALVIKVTIETGTLPGLFVGVPISADGQSVVARDVKQIGDGALTEILCSAE